MSDFTIIINDPPYGSERPYNALRLANSLIKKEDILVTVFLMGDAVTCAGRGQKTPDGYYNIERMLKPVVRRGRVLLCGTCMDARGMKEENIAEGCKRSTLDELTDLTISSDKVLVF
ncbi:MAG: hypothetical protein A2Y48_05235 [Nitrospirae bacterium RIFCSPLOW2_12_42_9]|nr:MAG: hypothetical protein A2Y48_05235 [Nitrospirae bacterium RIFCSPLOW2_12_42_9]HBI24256.1 hypothetical protein [Nitrospiraceae bacterium]